MIAIGSGVDVGHSFARFVGAGCVNPFGMTRHDHPLGPYGQRIERTLRHIDANLAGDLSLDALADVAALSRFHFSRVFRAQTGEGVADRVRRLRLNRAALLVVSSPQTASEIAAACGFGHVGSFERAFTAAFGSTPLEVRRALRIPPPLLAPERGEYTMFPTEIRTAETVTLAAVAHNGPYQEIGSAFEQLMTTLQGAGLWKDSGPSHAIYYDDPTEVPVEDLRSHACQRLRAGAEVPEGLDSVQLPGGRFLVCTCRGPFTRLPEAWAWTYGKALPEGGHAFREGLPFERYVTNSWETAPEDFITEIWVPVV